MKKTANHLIQEKSPYLLQHAYNPVNWYPWGDEAFARAEKENKPIFLSIGYSTCHWCHVMESESFEDQEVARLMNDTFVCIKVDREERPDVDDVYMTVCQAMTGHGGWPLTILMTPDKKPFFAATYLPKPSRGGRVGMLELIPRVKELWDDHRTDVLKQAESVTSQMRDALETAPAPSPLDDMIFDQAFREMYENYDPENGGFGSAPKFPSPHNFLFLLRYHQATGDPRAIEICEKTLRSMRFGGIFDQVGKGFHRYSTDAKWRLPHFEKMLYDQAMPALAYLEMYQQTGDEFYAKTAGEIFTYVLRDLTSPDGGFYSAEDADSEGEEGKFYVWEQSAIENVLKPEQAAEIANAFDLKQNGNFRDEATHEFTGKNIFVYQPQNNEHPGEKYAEELAALYRHRENRVRPHLDDKILTDWNGLTIAALARGGRVLQNSEYTQAAERAVKFVLEHLLDSQNQLLHRYRDGDAAVPGFSSDYAFFVFGLLEVYAATLNPEYLQSAMYWQRQHLDRFFDADNGAFFNTAHSAESLLFRRKEVYDAAIPSANSVSLHNLVRLARLTGTSEFESMAETSVRALASQVKRAPSAATFFLCSFYFLLDPGHQIVIVGDRNSTDTSAFLNAVNQRYLPNSVTLLKNGDEDRDLERVAPFTENYETEKPGAATVYVCRRFACQAPTRNVNQMMEFLK